MNNRTVEWGIVALVAALLVVMCIILIWLVLARTNSLADQPDQPDQPERATPLIAEPAAPEPDRERSPEPAEPEPAEPEPAEPEPAEPEPAAPPPPANLIDHGPAQVLQADDTLPFGGLTLQAEFVNRAERAGRLEAAAGNVMLYVRARLTNEPDGPGEPMSYQLDEHTLTAVASDGQTWPVKATLAGATLDPGGYVTTLIAVEVPEGTESVEITYQHNAEITRFILE